MDERELHRAREATLSGGRASRAPRTEIAASWRRVAASGVDPGGGAGLAPLPGSELEQRRTSSRLAGLVPRLEQSLTSVIDAGQLVVVTDAEGRVLWRLGGTGVRRLADRLGFVRGSAWTEGNVGTNAIGTSLVLGKAIQIRGAEHFVESHTAWGCAAAPLMDPWTGETLGVVDVSGPSRTLHPAELAVVEMAARLAALEVVEGRRAELDRLRAHAAPLLTRVTGQALVVDPHGHLALATGFQAPDRITLPSGMTVGDIWLPTLGSATAEAVPGGWLLRLGEREGSPTSVTVDLTGPAEIRVTGDSGSWSRELTPRHAELVLALARAGETGRSAAQLADDLFADPSRVVTVRAEMSRLRRALGGLLLAQPYRFAPGAGVRLELPPDRQQLLPASSAPVVRAMRTAAPDPAHPLDRRP
ncbi:GAF domain-containing protein [Nocardioides sp.]|uniref:GAF domain-containing protein n=1 Tax=Nocardioides sp. TaxID=35761 RepID=UPI002737019D|nr:GAF domain-containing protein [Nocardioides sp.]MDP3893501.1 GAF domain-containing protein [Nocardioides sp.]